MANIGIGSNFEEIAENEHLNFEEIVLFG